MTIICALHEPGIGTWIGSDRQWTEGGRIFVDATPTAKWVVHGGWAVGVAGVGLAINLVREAAPKLLGDLTSPAEFRDRLLPLLKEHLNPNTNERFTPDWGVHLLLCSADGIWDFDGALCYTPVPGISARGTGCQYALGAAWFFREHHSLESGEDVLRCAMGAAIYFDTDCGGEPYVGLLPDGAG